MSKFRIYWAGPLHDEADQKRNLAYVEQLRRKGYPVYLPQEHGLWEDFEDAASSRPMFYHLDLEAMQTADLCIAAAGPRPPSEGMLWEMGYMAGTNKPVYLLNAWGHEYNLMPEFGSRVFHHWEKLLEHLDKEGYV